MSERNRAFRALRGERFPRVGQRGRLELTSEYSAPHVVIVVVTHLSINGFIVRTRFVTKSSAARFGDNEQEWYRDQMTPQAQERGVQYYSDRFSRGPEQLHGTVVFIV